MLTTLLTSAIDTCAALFRQPTAQAVGWALLQFVWQGAAIGAVTGCAMFVLRRGAADVRYIVASIGMALMLTLPVVTAAQKYQALRISGLKVGESSDLTAAAADRAHSPVGSYQTGHSGLQAGDPSDRDTTSGAARRTLAPALMLLWLAGVMLLSLRLITGWFWTRRMRTHGIRPVEPAWDRMLAQLSRRLHISRTIALFESTRVDVPTVIGWLKPVVLLPASAIAALSPAQLEAILAHELAHILRHDYLVNLLQTVVETLLFYHPAVWW
ncbi:MAG TPA: M56 family metallopeptidase, partial [Vicinamibacterales bacterium]|nr:M56 family metallopeptidase [Vicinamibacterales bacterium]